MADRSRALSVACLALVVLLLSTCHPSMPESQVVRADLSRIAVLDVPDAQVAQLIAGNNAFAFDLYHRAATIENVNLIYSPVPKMDFGVELMYANREVESGLDGDLTRLQFSAKYAY